MGSITEFNEQELALRLTLISLEDRYFEDMRFECFSLADKYFRNQDLGYNLELNDMKISISEDYSMSAYHANTKTLQLLPEHVDDENVLLHEMIHAFEFLLDDTVPALREILALQLYKKLSAKHPDLDAYLDNFLNRRTFLDIAKDGGPHGLLFALKALDIDDRKGWKPGTTFGYIPYVPEK